MSSGDESRKKEDEYKRISISPRALREATFKREKIREIVADPSGFRFLCRRHFFFFAETVASVTLLFSSSRNNFLPMNCHLRKPFHAISAVKVERNVSTGITSDIAGDAKLFFGDSFPTFSTAMKKIVWHHSDRWRGLKFPSFCQSSFEKLDRFFSYFLLVYLFDPSQSRSTLFNIVRDYVVWDKIDGCGVGLLSRCHHELCF